MILSVLFSDRDAWLSISCIYARYYFKVDVYVVKTHHGNMCSLSPLINRMNSFPFCKTEQQTAASSLLHVICENFDSYYYRLYSSIHYATAATYDSEDKFVYDTRLLEIYNYDFWGLFPSTKIRFAEFIITIIRKNINAIIERKNWNHC